MNTNTKYTIMDYDRALESLNIVISNEDDLAEKQRLRELARELAKKKAVLFAEMLLAKEEEEKK